MAESGNFTFLRKVDEQIYTCARQAERLVYYDGHAAMMKLRLFGELLAQRIAARAGIRPEEHETGL